MEDIFCVEFQRELCTKYLTHTFYSQLFVTASFNEHFFYFDQYVIEIYTWWSKWQYLVTNNGLLSCLIFGDKFPWCHMAPLLVTQTHMQILFHTATCSHLERNKDKLISIQNSNWPKLNQVWFPECAVFIMTTCLSIIRDCNAKHPESELYHICIAVWQNNQLNKQ